MSEKHELMTKGFETWRKLALTRVGVNSVGVAEDKKEALDLVLEAAFEAGFGFGGSVAERGMMNDLKEHLENAAKNGNVIVTNGGIPSPDVGHA